MRYKILKSELKKTDYGEVRDLDCHDISGNPIQGSVWRKQKDGSDFPNFDGLVAGAEFEANAWTNPKTNKISFFPNKTPINANSGSRGANMSKVMEQKKEGIRESQERKEEAIRVSSTMRDAVLIATTMASYEKYGKQEMKDNILEWRAWLSDNWEV